MSTEQTVEATTGHDMSRYWRLVSNEGGLITGTWWVTREDRRGETVAALTVVAEALGIKEAE